MPYTYNKTNHLCLKVNNLHFINQTPKEMYDKCIKALFFNAVSTYDALICEGCGIKIENHNIIKNELACKIKYDKYTPHLQV